MAAGRDTESLGPSKSVDGDNVALALQAEEKPSGRHAAKTDSPTIEAIHDISRGANAQAGPVQNIQARQTSVDLRVGIRHVSSGTLCGHSNFRGRPTGSLQELGRVEGFPYVHDRSLRL